MKLLVKQFSPVSCHSSLLGPNILFSTLFPDIFILYSPLNIRDQVSQTYRTTGKIIVLYSLMLFLKQQLSIVF
jgi:hypothetical protein